ncbi:hypothetical protein JCM9533A_41490 [Catenuloplanes niger JCM 9533]
MLQRRPATATSWCRAASSGFQQRWNAGSPVLRLRRISIQLRFGGEADAVGHSAPARRCGSSVHDSVGEFAGRGADLVISGSNAVDGSRTACAQSACPGPADQVSWGRKARALPVREGARA